VCAFQPLELPMALRQLADVEWQCILHFCDLYSWLALALCARILRRVASDPVRNSSLTFDSTRVSSKRAQGSGSSGERVTACKIHIELLHTNDWAGSTGRGDAGSSAPIFTTTYQRMLYTVFRCSRNCSVYDAILFSPSTWKTIVWATV
jgi:hypothetical protein